MLHGMCGGSNVGPNACWGIVFRGSLRFHQSWQCALIGDSSILYKVNRVNPRKKWRTVEILEGPRSFS